MQRSYGGADVRRARYHASVIDSKTLGHGVPFAKLSEAFVIFITENDVLGGGKPIYHIDRRVKEMKNKLFNDGSHIIYVNASSPNLKTALGKLMFDLCCKDPDKMCITKSLRIRFDTLKELGKDRKLWRANTTRGLKESPTRLWKSELKKEKRLE